MAIGADYVTRAELKSYMGLETSVMDAEVDAAISSASRAIEKHCFRQFNLAGAATARVFYPLRPELTIVDDISDATGLIVKTDDDGDGVFENTWTIGTDFELQPLNGVRNGVPGWPYWKIVACGTIKSFRGSHRANVQVTANWGWLALPADVKQACKVLASDAFQYKDTRMGVAGADQFGTVIRVKDSGVACVLLKEFVRGRVRSD